MAIFNSYVSLPEGYLSYFKVVTKYSQNGFAHPQFCRDKLLGSGSSMAVTRKNDATLPADYIVATS